MKASLYQPQQKEIMSYIPYGSLIYHILQGMPIILWILFLYTFSDIPNGISTLFDKNNLPLFQYLGFII